jgi:signal transduction histidine kinase/HAMP domain-containing protein
MSHQEAQHVNPSLANRLRIGFAITFALLAGVTVIGVGRLFQLRQDYEDSITRSFQLELAGEHLRQAFLVEQSALHGAAGDRADRERYRTAAATSDSAVAEARGLIDDDNRARRLLAQEVAAEGRWRRQVALPAIAGRAPPTARQQTLAGAVVRSGDDLIASQGRERQHLHDKVSDDTRKTAILVGVGLISGLIAAILLFSGLIASMRRPLERLVDASGRLAEGDLQTRVEVGGPAETATLGLAFNEMADELQGAYRGIEESRRRLQVTMESLGDGVVTVDSNGIVTDTNPAARSLLSEARIGSPIRDVLLGYEVSPQNVDRLLAGRLGHELRTADGGAVLAIRASEMGTPEGGSVLSIRDISERARLERMKDEFVLTASHELRSPLTSVQGFAELLMLERDQLSEKHAETVEIILDNTRHLVRLLNDLLDLARSDAGRLTINPVRCEVGPIVAGGARLIMGLTNSRQQRLEVEIESDLPQVNVEPDRITQVLVNLLTNATEYCSEGATIKVTAASVGSEVEIAVSDDGPGIPRDQLDHVFDRFTRGEAGLTQRVGGTGLGLAIAKSLIELHGGAIGVTSKEGDGTTFRIVIPALPDREPVEEPAAAAVQG